MSPLLYIIQGVFHLAAWLFIARFLLQASRADFYNPISQAISKVTDPVLRPVRVILPGFRNFDFASIVIAWVLAMLGIVALYAIQTSQWPPVVPVLTAGLIRTALAVIQFYWWSILITIIASFVTQGGTHPFLNLLQQITEPLLGPARRLLPPLGPLDFSPIIVLLALGALEVGLKSL